MPEAMMRAMPRRPAASRRSPRRTKAQRLALIRKEYSKTASVAGGGDLVAAGDEADGGEGAEGLGGDPAEGERRGDGPGRG